MDLHRHSTATTARLWQDILLARATFHRVRHQQSLRNNAPSAVEVARSELVTALQAYAARLSAEGTPVPYRLRDELRLQSAVVAEQRR